ncbi:MAG TPA: serine hydrolase domain-containing protein [Allosphingosinicella sp.]|nr:serine hydrolase domain-containing protein [Allosphingosinicella sp.]
MKFLFAGILAICGIATVARQTVPLGPPAPKQQAESAAPVAPTPVPAGGAELNAADVNAWLDGYMPHALSANDMAGAVVVVVKDGQVLTQRGFGFSDVARRAPVDPAATLFRPGSISKLFTWTAVMQQVEQGRLDLDADVNRYLDFQIPPRDGQPITLRQIMSHTAGFEEQIKTLIGYDRASMPSTEEQLKRWIPSRVYAPGSTPAYSNYATALAGYIVQRVSHEPFDDYVERHIFAPLGMANSSMRQPLPPRLARMMSQGYRVASGEPVRFEIVGPAPAGSLSTTGADMARFMIAHLNNGAGLLRPETARAMHTTRFSYGIGPLPRMLLGFYEANINGQHVISHGGDTGAFHSEFFLFTDSNVGLFVSFNSGGRGGAALPVRRALFEQFADRYFPAPADTRRVPAATAAEHARLMTGNWTASRAPVTTFLNITELLGQTSVGVGKDGELNLPFQLGQGTAARRWVEVEPFVWHDLNSHEVLAAQVENGVPVRFSIATVSPFTVWDREPWYRNSALLLPLVYASLFILFLTAILWPTRWLVRRKFGATLALEKGDLRSYRLVRTFSWLILAVLIGWAVVLSMLGELSRLNSSFDPIIYFIQIATIIVLFGAVGVFGWDLWTVWRGKRRWTAKVWSIFVLLAGLVVLWIGWAFHLIGLGANY